MNQFRLHNRCSRLLLVLMTITALLFVQTLLLHAHGPHNHHQDAGHNGAVHQHHVEIHLAAMDPVEDEHDAVSKIDLAAKAVVKNIKFSNPLLAILTLFVVLLMPLLISNKRWLIHRKTPFSNHRSLLRPPLRAPPF